MVGVIFIVSRTTHLATKGLLPAYTCVHVYTYEHTHARVEQSDFGKRILGIFSLWLAYT